MDPKISNLDEKNGVLTFSLENINNFLLNSIRRVITADIPTFVFRTFPHEENEVEIEINTSRHNNEILKQRLGCIPIYIDDLDFPYNDYQVEVDKKNTGDTIEYLTTADFKIFNKKTNQYLTDTSVRKIFPANSITNDYIIIARLRPKLSENLEGEHIKFTANINLSTAKFDGMYNVASTCSFGASIDPIKADDAWNNYKKDIKKEDLEFEKKNWDLLQKKRYIKENSYEFTLETIGVYTNMRLLDLACEVLIKKLNRFVDNINSGTDVDFAINKKSTIPNEYLITLVNEDYTVGNIVNYVLYEKYYTREKSITFCGFRKPHPHIDKGEMRIAFREPTDVATVALYLTQSANKCIDIYKNMKTYFSQDIE